LLEDLNEPQRQAVLATEGPLLVLAGAGSGKTRVLTYRVAYLIHGKEVPPRHVLAFTFTNKAAGEMKDRVAYLLGGAPRDLWVGTFHATGVRILRQDGRAVGVEPGFTIYDTDDQESLIRTVLKELGWGDRDLSPKAVRSAISAAKNALLTPAEFEAQADSYRTQRLAKVFAEYQRRLRSANALDFDDLIGEPIRLFEEHPDVKRRFAERFRYVLVDEYQDTNPAQSRLIRHLASGYENLCVVGDDDQSIYGWRGADVGNILSFETLYPAARVIRLEQNYRSTGTILAAANAVVKHNQARKDKTLWTERGEGDRLALTVTGDEEEEAIRVVATTTAEVNHRGIPLSEVAVLYRTNAQSRAVETAFRHAAIPYELVGGTAFYQRREVKDLLAYLRLLVNDQDDLAFSRVVNVPRRGIGASTLERLTEHAYREGKSLLASLETADRALEIPPSGREKLLGFRTLLEEFRSRAGEPVDALIKHIVERTGYLEHLESDDPDTAYDRVENVEELVAGAQVYAERNDEAGLQGFLNEVALLTDVDRVDETAEKVRLMTIHNAKGLEFRVVCVTGLEEGLLPHASSLETDPDVEEERRLFYVAMTRAKDRVHLFASVIRRHWGAPAGAVLSRFIEEIPDDLLTVADLAPRWGERPERTARREEPRAARRRGDERSPAYPSGPRRSLGTIVHPTFGRGDVVEQEGSGPDARLTVIFPGGIKKKIVARFAEWEESHVDL
jgi:DNA helicase-2/ATP-dependent DNA helicase PcrA